MLPLRCFRCCGAAVVVGLIVLELWVGHESQIFQRHVRDAMTSSRAVRDAMASGKAGLAGPHVSFSLLLAGSLPAPPEEDDGRGAVRGACRPGLFSGARQPRTCALELTRPLVSKD